MDNPKTSDSMVPAFPPWESDPRIPQNDKGGPPSPPPGRSVSLSFRERVKSKTPRRFTHPLSRKHTSVRRKLREPDLEEGQMTLQEALANNEEAIERESVEENSNKENFNKENSNKGESDKEESNKEESIKGDSTKEDSTKEDSTKEDSVKEEPTKEDSAEQVSAKEDSAKEESTEHESTEEDSAKEDSIQEESIAERWARMCRETEGSCSSALPRGMLDFPELFEPQEQHPQTSPRQPSPRQQQSLCKEPQTQTMKLQQYTQKVEQMRLTQHTEQQQRTKVVPRSLRGTRWDPFVADRVWEEVFDELKCKAKSYHDFRYLGGGRWGDAEGWGDKASWPVKAI